MNIGEKKYEPIDFLVIRSEGKVVKKLRPDQFLEIFCKLMSDQRILAIKVVRDITGLGLKASKEYVDQFNTMFTQDNYEERYNRAMRDIENLHEQKTDLIDEKNKMQYAMESRIENLENQLERAQTEIARLKTLSEYDEKTCVKSKERIAMLVAAIEGMANHELD